jgi:hypothetical protein
MRRLAADMAILDCLAKHGGQRRQDEPYGGMALALGKESIGKLLDVVPRDSPDVLLSKRRQQIETVGLFVQIVGVLFTMRFYARF